jgi:DTW domain-containing protein YfiP
MPNPPETTAAAPEPIPECPHCQKPMPLCICDSVTPIENRLSLLILQHPQEQDRGLGTARLLAKHFAKATVRVGLSWPSLSKALGRHVENASHWAVLYLGSARAADLEAEGEILALNRKGEVADNQRALLGKLEGVVLLDGTWSQAKALWWRNAWMLKCRRIVLGPSAPSRYGKVRKEPRADALSTIEAAGMLLARLEKKPAIEKTLTDSFERLLTKYHEATQSGEVKVPKPVKKDWRGVKRRRR